MSAADGAIRAPESSTLGGLAAGAAERLAGASATPRLDAELLVAHAAGVDRAALFAFPEREVPDGVRAALEGLVERRRDGVPVAYLLGRREFHALSLRVTPAVLVPRPETELAVDTVLQLTDAGSRAEILDLGTGSGAIALAVKHARPRARVTAVDSSAEALAVARGNAEALGLEIELVEADWFAGIDGRRFDIVVANPPYVERGNPALSGALRHEPAAALDGGEDGLDAIRSIVGAAPAHLRSGGHLLIEHGDRQGAAVARLARRHGFARIRILRDLAGLPRLLVARRP